MKIFFLSFGLLLFSILALSIGVLMGRKPLAGSCGGLGKIFGKNGDCQFCEKRDECNKKIEELNSEP